MSYEESSSCCASDPKRRSSAVREALPLVALAIAALAAGACSTAKCPSGFVSMAGQCRNPSAGHDGG
ncbi:MAG TPA: hypothetical protein VF331_19180, partial [Polyangiales bacterium]